MNLKRPRSVFVCIAVAMSVASCSQGLAAPPYAITEQSVRVGESLLYDFAGAHIVFTNVTERSVRSVSLSFLVFDAEGALCSPLGNCVTTSYRGKIPAHQSMEIVVSLDGVIGPHTKGSYVISNLFASEIAYADGTVWQDPFGLYAE